MKRFHSLLLACVFCLSSLVPLSAEIVWIDIYWTEACSAQCTKMVQERLSAVSGASHVDVYPSQGRARILWRPNHRLDYMMLKSAVAWVGVDISDMLIQVRGQIQNSSSNMTLISSGDNTRFVLLGTPIVSQTQMTNWENSASYPLSHAVRTQLWNAKQNNSLVTIQGPIFQFWNPAPFNLIVSQLEVGDGKPQNLQKTDLPPQAPFRNDPWHGQPSRFNPPPPKVNAIKPV